MSIWLGKPYKMATEMAEEKETVFGITIDKHLGMSVFQQLKTEDIRETMYSLYTMWIILTKKRCFKIKIRSISCNCTT